MSATKLLAATALALLAIGTSAAHAATAYPPGPSATVTSAFPPGPTLTATVAAYPPGPTRSIIAV
jgi:hypothetical protein